jgi:DNA-binding response OmpR family regulator
LQRTDGHLPPTISGKSAAIFRVLPDNAASPKIGCCIAIKRPHWGHCMGSTTLFKGRSILVLEDEPLIRFELTSLFESAGAQVIPARTCQQAVEAVEQSQIGAALLDHGLRGDNVAPLCAHLADCQIPYMFYTGCPDLEHTYPRAIIIQKPASAEVLLAAMADLMARNTYEWVKRVANSRGKPQPEAVRQVGRTIDAAMK